MQVTLSNLVGKAFHELIDPILDNQIEELVLTGGRGSGKSSFDSTIIPYAMMEDYHIRGQKTNAVILRKIANTLAGSVYNSIVAAINRLKVAHKWKCTKSPMRCIYKPSGQQIIFAGCDDPSKVKSITVQEGWIKYRWFEEYDQFDGLEEIRNLNQSLARGPITLGLYSYNPPPNAMHWANIEALDDRTPGRLRHHSTYLDIPFEWLGKKFISDAAYLKTKNYAAYENEYLGVVTGTGGEIFKNVKSIELTDEEILSFERIRQGLDFGFTIDPSSFVKVCYQKNRNKITIFDSYYDYHVPTKDLAIEVNKRCTPYETIKADSAEQRTIDTMINEYGCNVYPCRKGADSVRHGIKWLQGLDEIAIDRKRCPDPYREFSTYQHEKNKEGKFINKYPDENNHSIDATRYSLDDIILCAGWRVGTKERI